MALSSSVFACSVDYCAVEPFPDEFGGTGLACSRWIDDNERLLFVPLHDCLVVADHTAPSLAYRGRHRVCIHEVLGSFQSKWQCSIPRPLQDHIHNRNLDKELRLTALLAWVKLHTPSGDHWKQWFSSLPVMEDVPLLSTANDEELQIFREYAPHLEACATRARNRADAAWTSAVAAAPHIWLNLWNLVPGTAAPVSFPVDVDEPDHKSPSRDLRCKEDFANHDALSPNSKFQLGEVSGSWASATTEASKEPSPGLELRARIRMAKGDRVTINYGADKTSILLLEAYGFSTPASLADRLPWKWRKQRHSAFADLTQFAEDLKRLDTDCLSVLTTLGVDISTICSGERPPVELAKDVEKRRWMMAAINAFECLTWASDQPTVLQLVPEVTSCVDSDGLLQRQARLSQILTVEKQIDKLCGAATLGTVSAEIPSHPPTSCRTGLWNAAVDFMECVQHVRMFLQHYRYHEQSRESH